MDYRMAKFVLLFIPAAVLCAQQTGITITGGAADDQVYQRDGDNRAAITLTGAARGMNGRAVEYRVLGRNGALAGADWKSCGKVAGDRWQCQVSASTGGPYRIETRVSDSVAAVNGILVGDLWVLAGQSNMEGAGDLVNVEPPNGLVHSFDMTDRWVLAEEPLHTLVSAADSVHWRRNENKQPERYEGERLAKFVAARRKGAGLGLPFAVEMVRRTGVPVGLLPCAHGGTSMDQWNPDLRDKGGESLYGSTIRRVKAAGGKVSGILWYQGESDANPKAAPVFREKFERLVASFRSDIGQPDLPFYYVQIGRHVNNSNVSEWNHVQEMQRQAELTVPNSGLVTAVDLTLDDGIHVGVEDLKLLGKRMANLACHDLFPGHAQCGWLQRGPRPSAVRVSGNTIRIAFSGVNGKLTSAGRVAGFSVHDAAGNAVPAFFRAEVDPNDATVIRLYTQGNLPEGAALRYCAGKDTYCNVRDSAGMGLPVFGPIPIER
jgi:sialate O-acetylesterase